MENCLICYITQPMVKSYKIHNNNMLYRRIELVYTYVNLNLDRNISLLSK